MEKFIVICLSDDYRYVQAIRKQFCDRIEAEDYADSIAKSRKPIVVPLPLEDSE